VSADIVQVMPAGLDGIWKLMGLTAIDIDNYTPFRLEVVQTLNSYDQNFLILNLFLTCSIYTYTPQKTRIMSKNLYYLAL